MDIERPATGEIKHILGQYLSEGGDDKEVGMICREGLFILCSLERSRLPHGKTVSQRSLFHRRKNNSLPPSHGLIRAGDNGGNLVALWEHSTRGRSLDKRFERGYRELWGTHVNNA